MSVHHHVETAPCKGDGSVKLKAGMHDSTTMLKLGKKSDTVFQSYARTIKVQGHYRWYEHLSPKMGITVDQKYIYILGGVPLSVKQYERTHTGGVNRLVRTLVTNVCTVCGYRGIVFPKLPKHSTQEKPWVEYCKKNRGLNTDITKQGVGLHLSTMFTNQKSAGGLDFAGWAGSTSPLLDEVAGGHLTLQLADDGVAERIYGVSHCGTVFMLEPKVKPIKVTVLHHATFGLDVHWRVEVGLALQRYEVPSASGRRFISNLFVSTSKAYFASFDETRTVVEQNSDQWRVFRDGERRGDKGFGTYRFQPSGFRPTEARISKVQVNAVCKYCYFADLRMDEEASNMAAGKNEDGATNFISRWGACGGKNAKACLRFRHEARKKSRRLPSRMRGQTNLGQGKFGCKKHWKPKKEPKDMWKSWSHQQNVNRAKRMINNLKNKKCHRDKTKLLFFTERVLPFFQNRSKKIAKKAAALGQTIQYLDHAYCKVETPTVFRAIGAEAIQYYSGALWWYAGGELHKHGLDKTLSCSELEALILPETKKWCPKGICTAKIHADIIEGGLEQPWTVKVYKKVYGQPQSIAGSQKTAICSHPKRPTTRHSPPRCCMTKQLKVNGKATTSKKDLNVVLL